jgi:hypothetical protein
MTAKRAFLISGQLERLQSLMRVLRERTDMCRSADEREGVEACLARYEDQYDALLQLQGLICSTNQTLERDHEGLTALISSLTRGVGESDNGDERAAMLGCIHRYEAQLAEVERLLDDQANNDVGC